MLELFGCYYYSENNAYGFYINKKVIIWHEENSHHGRQ